MAKKENKKVVVGMSGGVDSSVALFLLQQAGWEPLGLTFDLPKFKQKAVRILVRQSIERAKAVCQKAGVPHFVLSGETDFKKKVLDYFKAQYRQGLTPNPCLVCNRFFKFKNLIEFANKKGVNYVATGHYAAKEFDKKTKKWQLLRPYDKNKDQTYYLSLLSQRHLEKTLFPLSGLAKEEVYQKAENLGLDFPRNVSSQDFCFLAGASLEEFLEKELGQQPGKIVDETGKVLGTHAGIHFYTVGQRKGLRLEGGPYFVASLDFRKNLVIITKDKKSVNSKKLKLFPFSFISGEPPQAKIRVEAKIRYKGPLSSAFLLPLEKNKLKIIFDQPQITPAPGQFCVFYQNDVCLGGAMIL